LDLLIYSFSNLFDFSSFNYLARWFELSIKNLCVELFGASPHMKMKIPLIAAFVAGMPVISGGFTLDAVGFGGSELSLNPVSVFVPGYGELIFEAAVGSALVVNSAYQNDNGFGGPSLNFDQNDAIKITFNGLEPLKVDFDFNGVSAGESFMVQKDLFTPQAFLVTLQGGGAGAGL
jgi:hypothetical protein